MHLTQFFQIISVSFQTFSIVLFHSLDQYKRFNVKKLNIGKIKFQVLEKSLNKNGKNFIFTRGISLRINDGLQRYGQMVNNIAI